MGAVALHEAYGPTPYSFTWPTLASTRPTQKQSIVLRPTPPIATRPTQYACRIGLVAKISTYLFCALKASKIQIDYQS